MIKLKEIIYLLNNKKFLLCAGLIFILLSLISLVKADDSIYIKSDNAIMKDDQFKIVTLSNVTSDIMIDNINIYFYTEKNFYIANKSNGNIIYKINILGIKQQKQTNNYTYVKTNNQIYKINKTSGVIEQKQVFGNVIDKIYSFFGVNTLSLETQNIYYNTTINQYDNLTLNQKWNKTDTLNRNYMPSNVSFNDSSLGMIIVKKSGFQNNIQNNVWTLVTFDTELFDENNEFSNNNYSAPISGWYRVTSSLYLTDNGAADYRVRVYINGVSSGYATSFTQYSSGADFTLSNSAILHLNQNDIVGLYFYHTLLTNTVDIYHGEGTYFEINLIKRG